MERLAHSTRTSVEFLHHTLNLFTETSLIEVEGEDILATVELFQWTPVLIRLANLQWSDDGLQFLEQGVR